MFIFLGNWGVWAPNNLWTHEWHIKQLWTINWSKNKKQQTKELSKMFAWIYYYFCTCFFGAHCWYTKKTSKHWLCSLQDSDSFGRLGPCERTSWQVCGSTWAPGKWATCGRHVVQHVYFELRKNPQKSVELIDQNVAHYIFVLEISVLSQNLRRCLLFWLSICRPYWFQASRQTAAWALLKS